MAAVSVPEKQKGFDGLSVDCVAGTLSSDAAWDDMDTTLALTANKVVTSTPTSSTNHRYVVDNVILCNGIITVFVNF